MQHHMRTRDKRVRIHFTEKEMQDLKRKAAEAGLDCSKYIRAKLSAVEVIPGPQVDVPTLIAAINHAGQQMEDVLVRARSGTWDDLAFRKALEKVRQANNAIHAAYEEGTHK
jgi:hypothetical protein